MSSYKIISIETSPTTSSHDVGDLIKYNGVIYKTKTAIAVGDNLVIDTNIEFVSPYGQNSGRQHGLV